MAVSATRETTETKASPQDLLALLPDPLLVRIFEQVAEESKPTLCNISRLNHRYHALADAILYETIHFITPELHMLFSESLRRRPRRGSIIREVKLAYPASKVSQLMIDAPVHGSFYDHAPVRFDSLSRTLSTMSNLEDLDIAVPVELLPGIGKLFDGPFDLACLKTCTLYYQSEEGEYWDLQETIHIFSHPSLETLVIKHAKLDTRGFDSIERPHETALTKLHFIECDINDDALSDILMFPKALTEFVLTQTVDSVVDLEESSDRVEDYILAVKSACHSLESITIDVPTLKGHRALRMRDFDALKTLRLNWDYQLFGSTSPKPRLISVGLPPSLEVLEFFNPVGTDEEVLELLVHTIENLEVSARNLKSIVIDQGEDHPVPPTLVEACKTRTFPSLDIIGGFDMDDDTDETNGE